nr:uncharacterized protein LOC108017364 [Drosophila suzukii]
MNVLQGFVLFFLGLVLSGVDAQVATRSPQEMAWDKACGPGRYFSRVQNVCWPVPG